MLSAAEVAIQSIETVRPQERKTVRGVTSYKLLSYSAHVTPSANLITLLFFYHKEHKGGSQRHK